MRPNAHLYLRPDAWRYAKPGTEGYDPPPGIGYREPAHYRLARDEAALAGATAAATKLASDERAFRRELAALRFELQLLKLSLAGAKTCGAKANFDPAQPRDDEGRWTDAGGGAGQDQIGQSLATASDQPARDDLLQLEMIANDPAIRAQIDEVWTASRPHETIPQEHGFWISRNVSGELFARPFANRGSMTQIVPGPVPDDAIAFFHTHPNQSGFEPGPSRGDRSFAATIGLPGIIRSHRGMYYFGPRLR